VSENIITLMLGISTALGAFGLAALLWGVKTGQFDDKNKFLDAARYDNIEDLQDAAMIEQKKKEALKKKKEKNYKPAD
jgi:cbb3-type cytochrome oxidase maturation protein